MSVAPNNSGGFNTDEDETLIDKWRTEKDDTIRDLIINEMSSRGLFPGDDIDKDEKDGALYPDTRDDYFLQKLLRKREFAESKADPFKMLDNDEKDPCSKEGGFEITSVQRFISNFLSPRTPYNSALLYHGVGVGKTQAAIQVAEGFLEVYPRKKIIILAPVTIQPGFFRNIFDISTVKIGDGENEPNTANQGTGDLYMRLTGTLYEKNIAVIEKKVNDSIRRRYTFFGNLAFRNYIRKLIEKRVGRSRESTVQLESRILREEFSGRVLIIDEAHHLKDEESATEDGEDIDTEGVGGKKDLDDSKAGSRLMPFLKKILAASEGMKLVLMTATPMYNTAREIVTLLNILLLNDKKATLTDTQLFDRDGNLRKKSTYINLLYRASSAYISYMRGENPRTFPVRLNPNEKLVSLLEKYPSIDPGGKVVITDAEKTSMMALPLVKSELQSSSQRYIKYIMDEEIDDSSATNGRYSINLRDKLIQAGNVLFPIEEERYGITGFSATFRKEGTGVNFKYKCKEGISPSWLAENNIREYSPKAYTILKSVRSAKNVQFIYSRFVITGALFLALVLEANGYTLYGRPTSILADAIQSVGGRQCALCENKEKNHPFADHSFTPAKYVLLTGDDELSPKNSDSIAISRGESNKNGKDVKIVIGSQVASEGVDLRFIREIHIFDSWYHLNKTDQVIGRGIRYCSHSLLPAEDRNATIFLHVVTFPETSVGGQNALNNSPTDNVDISDQETIDLYSYRMALKKAKQVGEVSRILKQHAIDCNLNKEAIQIIGQPSIRMVDSQGMARNNVNINDTPFSPLCDWLERCDYKCIPEVSITSNDIDDTTYDEFSSKYRESILKNRVNALFSKQPFYYAEDFLSIFSDVPRQAFGLLLTNILGNKNFKLQHKNLNGYLIYRNGFFLFQPNQLKDESIPLVLRTALFPVKRDIFSPKEIPIVEFEEPEEEEVIVEEIEDKWDILKKWVNEIFSRGANDIPEHIHRLVAKIASNNEKHQKRLIGDLEIIIFIYSFFKKNMALKKTVLEYIYDEWLTQPEQETLLKNKRDEGYGNENIVTVGNMNIFRFLNTKTDTIEYKKDDGSTVPKALLDIIQTSKTDAIINRTPIFSTTGSPYGFMVSKKGSLIFKKGRPVANGKKPDRGAECANVSEKANKIKEIQEIIEIFGKQNIDDITFKKVQTTNAIQLCTFTDIFLRFLDSQKTRNLRWFFRPIASIASGHKGKI